MFLNYINNFRGVAILFIVAGHCNTDLVWTTDNLTKTLINDLFANGTVLFVFIAGFLFQHLLVKYHTKRYLINKLTNVILPYLLFSIPAIYMLTTQEWYGMKRWLADDAFYQQPVMWQIALWYLTGAHLSAYWFIPMISLFYLIAPVLKYLDSKPKFYYLLPIFFLLATWVGRPPNNDNILKAFIYFFPVYTFGMFFSHYRERILEVIDKYLIPLLLVTILVILWQFFLPEQRFVNLIQKVLFCCLIVYWLRRYDVIIKDKFSTLAEFSFGIYFIHPYILLTMHYVTDHLGCHKTCLQGSLLTFLVVFPIITTVSTLLLMFVKKVIGKKSRWIIGC